MDARGQGSVTDWKFMQFPIHYLLPNFAPFQVKLETTVLSDLKIWVPLAACPPVFGTYGDSNPKVLV
jgi:hypothetical protein